MTGLSNSSKNEITDICNKVLKRQLSIIQASRILGDYRDNFDIKNYSDILLFDEIKFESVHLPIGIERNKWNAGILREKDKESERASRDAIKRCYTKFLSIF